MDNKEYFKQIDNGMRMYCKKNKTICTRNCGRCVMRYVIHNFNLTEKDEHKQGFPILDTSKISLVTEVEKLTEETHEFINAISNNDTENMIEEFFDVIQVMLNILHRYELTDKLEEGLSLHNEKIVNRNWNIEKYL